MLVAGLVFIILLHQHQPQVVSIIRWRRMTLAALVGATSLLSMNNDGSARPVNDNDNANVGE